MGLPRINLLCPSAFAGFCFRALAGTAKAANAALTTRKLENLQSAKTEAMLKLSALKSDIQIAGQRLVSLGQEAEDAKLDRRIFNDKHQAPAPRKGIFSRRLSPEQKATEGHRRELEQISKQCKEAASAQKDSAAKLAKELKKQDKALRKILEKQAKKTGQLSSQVAAEVINKVIAGDADSARGRLASLRQLSRGNLMLGVLCVIVELLAEGPSAAKKALKDARLIFEQHTDSIVPVLEGLVDVVDGKAKLEKNPCAYNINFSSEEFYFLAELAAVLGGFGPENTELESPPFLTMVGAIYQSKYPDLPADDWALFPEKYMAEIACMSDLVVETLVCSSFLVPNKRLWLLSAAGLAQIKFFDPSTPYESTRPLLDIIKSHDNPAWPKALTKPWQLSMASMALLGAYTNAPEDIFEQWLDESYNWPKCDLYWWVLSEIKQDKALLQNISGSPTELFTVDPV